MENYGMSDIAKYESMVEMGKPVVYLYPEDPQDVSVKVYPEGGITTSSPKYTQGWTVKAHPDGNIYSYKQDRSYPYLFWEGHGSIPSLPDKGFVVQKDNIRNFLEDKLQKLGLKESEYEDFIEYWAPRMQKDPYYLVRFIDQEKIEEMAPLRIDPDPDTVIRVLMDFRGLGEKVEMEEPEITTPERQGFTVVEWGGIRH